jgi:hypothetical protein
MGTQITHTITDPTGAVHTRRSSGRRYSHAVVAINSDGAWAPLTWCSRRDLAEKAMGQWRYYKEKKVVPVARSEKETKEKPAAQYPGTEFEVGGLRFADTITQWGHEMIAQHNGWKIGLLRCNGGFKAYGQPINPDPKRYQFVRTKGVAKLENTVAKVLKLIAEAE